MTTPSKRRRRWWLIPATLLLLLAGFVVPTVWGKPWSIRHFYLRALAEVVWESPMLCSSLRLLDFRKDRLDDFSPRRRERLRALFARSLATLHRYDRASLPPSERLSFDVMDWYLRDLQATDGGAVYAIEQLEGLHVALPTFLTTLHTLESRSDAEAYVARVAASGVAFDQLLETIRDDAKRGVVPPRFILQKILADARAFAETPTADNPITRHLKTKVEALHLDAATQQKLVTAVEARLDDTLRPAYRRLITALDAMLQTASDDAGVWRLPDGDKLYAAFLRSGTAADVTADEVHALGLREVARIEAELRPLLAARGSSTENIGAALRALGASPDAHYPDTDAGRRQMLADYQKIIDDIDGKLGGLFTDRPKVGVKVEPVPAFRAKTAPMGQYYPPPVDNSRPGTFFVNLDQIDKATRHGMRTLAYHEATPGHHFQIVIARQQAALPMFRQLVPINSYVEGWALYAEQLAAEQGFEADPLDRIGYLSAQLFRASRLVVDTGLHAKRWTRQQAIDYMLAHSSLADHEAVIEVERYVVWPGQACGYMIGRLKILELREREQQRLGASFSLAKFHDRILAGGALPMTLLPQALDAAR